jgi:hypothetical protein
VRTQPPSPVFPNLRPQFFPTSVPSFSQPPSPVFPNLRPQFFPPSFRRSYENLLRKAGVDQLGTNWCAGRGRWRGGERSRPRRSTPGWIERNAPQPPRRQWNSSMRQGLGSVNQHPRQHPEPFRRGCLWSLDCKPVKFLGFLRAGEGGRTLDFDLGKVALYH